MKKSIFVCLVVGIGLLSEALFADDLDSNKLLKNVELRLDIDAINQLNINAGAGDLEITGKEGQSEITVIAKVYADDLSEAEYVLSLEKEGETAILIAQFNGNTYNNQRIDLTVLMPSHLALFVDDSSGDVFIESVNNGLTLNDRSGDIELSDIAGQVKIEDRSGQLLGKNLQGDVFINDRSGDIQLKGVDGNLNIEDSSGDIHAKKISGVVTIADSSGDININGAADFKLKSDSSGDVSLKNIKRHLK